ncbi:hypothetical protein DFP93_102305 [Aneurinibacillus soli]|uniref:Uncharacterized protein n=1 Tax=Aneurinibacillus soli TaxID=1500254 RepID=A0A0U4WFG4_9BACL|nr:hypothetical protein [Aneurinibacillus soli]PYE63618.1 hypothetical protein DFP93_102305 [Aneurinibacillus soli]BAU27449.1 hypothetical protein CB4_01623 [Aneurinibacillus soli]
MNHEQRAKEALMGAITVQELADYLQTEGYKAVQAVIFYLEKELRAAVDEAGLAAWEEAFERAYAAVPTPGQYSPSWHDIWDELRAVQQGKTKVLARVAPEERTGVWQVTFDNPYSTEGVVCHPGLSLADAAYLYAGYRYNLKKNEHVCLQKVQTYADEAGE